MTKSYDKQNYGIYTITNTVNGKTYIGQTIQMFRKRWSVHRSDLKKDKHPNPHLRNAAAKYGHEAFRMDVLEAGPQGLTKEERVAWCNKRETYWLGDAYLSDDYYNLQSGGNNAVPGPETRRRMSEAQKGTLNFKGKKHTEEARRKISEAKKGKSQPIVTCPWCGKTGGTTMHRWHMDNCKHKEG